MGNKNILCYTKNCLFVFVAVCLFAFIIACVLITCFRHRNKEMPILTIALKANAFQLSDSTYYIESIEILDFFHNNKLYEMSLNNGEGVSKINLSSLSKGYVSKGSFELSDTNEYSINIRVVRTNDKKTFYFNSVLMGEDSIPKQVKPIVLRP